MKSAWAFDWRDAYRSLRATPVVTTIALLSLALGIGANTALFSILNSLVLKSLPVRAPEQLALLQDGSWTNPIWEQIRDDPSGSFNGGFAWSSERFNLSGGGETDFVNGAYASGGIFDVLGVPALRGRTFTKVDDVRNGGARAPVAVVSYGFWQRRFGGAENVIGRQLTVEQVAFTIVGVVAPGFFGPDVGRVCDVYIPLSDEGLIRGKESFLDGRSTWWLDIMVRLKPNQTLDQANLLLRGRQPLIRNATLPNNFSAQQYLKDPFTLVSAATGNSPLRSRYQQPLTIMMVVVGAVLLIACANIANLLLARAQARRHELVVRLALGASRFRLGRQLLLESVILATTGGVLGLVLAQFGSALLIQQLATPTNTVFLDATLDWRVLAVTAGLSGLTALIFGLAPALGVTRVTPNEALKEQSRGVIGDRRFSLRHTLVVVQVALSLALVVAAGLFVRSFSSLMAVPLGFDPNPLLVVEANAQQSLIPPEQRPALFERFRAAAIAIPGVVSAGSSVIRPVSGQGWNTEAEVAGGPVRTGRDRMSWKNGVSPQWFATYGMQLIAGRDFTAADRLEAPRVAIVNQAFVKHFVSGPSVVGQRIKQQGPGGSSELTEIVGVVNDAVYRRPREGAVPTMYVPLTQMDRLWPTMTITLRLRPGPQGAVSRQLIDAFGKVDSRTAFTLRPFGDQIRTATAQERLIAILSGFFGGLALLLAGLGLYGVTSYSVTRRRTEIGVRMALGANPAGVVRLVLRRVGWLVGAGVVAGVGLSWWASRFVAASLLFGLQPHDPGTIVGAAVVLAAVGGIAGWLPARRASRIDPTRVLEGKGDRSTQQRRTSF